MMQHENPSIAPSVSTLNLEPLVVEKTSDAVSLLAATTGLSKSRIKDAMTKGAVWLDAHGRKRRLRRAKTMLNPGESIALYYSEEVLQRVPGNPLLLEQETSYSVWIKPAGVLSGGTRFGDHCAINRIVEQRLDRPAYLVHRLDRFAWGIMILAHSKQSAAHLSRQFHDRTVVKQYEAVVHGVLESDVTIEQPIEGRSAVSHARTVESRDNFSLVSVEIETGRKHQIRRHLAEIGHPIAGDRQYGSVSSQDLQLAAVSLSLVPPGAANAVTWHLPDGQRPQLSDVLEQA